MSKSLGQIRYEAHHGTEASWAQLPLEEWQRWEKLAHDDLSQARWLLDKAPQIEEAIACLRRKQQPGERLYVEACRRCGYWDAPDHDELPGEVQAVLELAARWIQDARTEQAFDPYAAVFGPAYLRQLKSATKDREDFPEHAAACRAHVVAFRAARAYDEARSTGAVQPYVPAAIVKGAGGGGERKGGGHA